MDTFVAGAVLATAILGVALLLRRAVPGAPEMESVRAEIKLLAARVTAESSLLGRRLEGIDSRVSSAQIQSSNLAADIFATLGDVARHTSTVADQAREFTALKDLLRAPKARGGIGEAMLEELLAQILPPRSYELQHRFRSGVVVDAIVRMRDRLVCIDSKFPLSNYQRMCAATDDAERTDAERAFGADVHGHIRDISCRYVIPDEGTLDFAIMYVPAEGLYGEVLRLSHRKRPLFETAIDARVMPMSPLTLYGYLQTVLFGLRCLSIEKGAEKILGFCGRLEQDMARFAAEYETLGRHITNARSKYEEGASRLDRFRGTLERVGDYAQERGGPGEALAD